MKKVKNINTISDFFEYIQNKKCICFGAGKQLEEVCRDIPALITKLEYILDNNSLLHNTKKVIAGYKKNIFLPQILKSENISKLLLIITSSYRNEILLQLNSMSELDELEYCDFLDILDAAAWGGECPSKGYKKNNEPMIPKVIHYIWFSDRPIPAVLQKNIDKWKKLCYDYKICCWNEKNYDYTKNPYMYQAYKDKKWSFVSDYARLDIIYNHGGIYFDTDVELIRRPDELLYNDAFIGFERISSINTGSGFGAIKEFHLIKEMRDFYINVEFINSDNPNDMILCPIYETAILQKHGLRLDGNFQIVDGISVYPVMYFNAKSLYSNKLKITENTISVHHCSWTWAGNKSKLKEMENKI